MYSTPTREARGDIMWEGVEHARRELDLNDESMIGVASQGATRLRVFYIRHGQSQWNAAQSEARAGGASAAEVRALGAELRFTDSPLSIEGVRQAGEDLRGLVDAISNPDAPATIAQALNCATSGACRPPAVLTSNLRRAIDTCLLGLRPVLEALPTLSVAVLPALQESCHYTDCEPIPRRADGTIEPPLVAGASAEADVAVADAALSQTDADHQTRTLIQQVLALQAAALEGAALSDDERAFLRAAYARRLDLAAVAPPSDAAYDDRRRVPEGVTLRALESSSRTALTATLQPLRHRLGDLLSTLFAHASDGGGASTSGSAPSSPPFAVIAAHSRLLREMLWAFRASRLAAPIVAPSAGGGRALSDKTAPPSTTTAWELRWDAARNAPECAALAADSGRLSNTGVVAFTLGFQPPDAVTAGSVTLHDCVLDAGHVMVRQPTEAAVPPTGWLGPRPTTEIGVALLALLISSAAVRRYRKRTPPPARDRGGR